MGRKESEKNVEQQGEDTYDENNKKLEEEEEETVEEFLQSVYYDPLDPGGYTGLKKLWNSVKTDNP